MKLVCATHNKGKLREITAVLAPLGFEIISAAEAGYEGEPEENGSTFYENARIKAEAIMTATGLPALADDSGLQVDALNGAPGIYSARYGGFDDDAERNNYLLRNISHVEPSKRTARFVCCLCCLFPDGREITAEGYCEGVLLTQPRGTDGFGYDPIFCIPSLGKTLAQISMEEKNKISHRANALRLFAERLQSTERRNYGTDQ